MADIHGFLPEYDDDTDMLIIAGDVGPGGVPTREWMTEYFNWTRPDRIALMVIPGNHDPFDGPLTGYEGNYHGVHVWGSPVTVGNSKGRTHVMDDERAWKYYEKMPRGVDIAVVHSPPYGILDDYDGEHIGSRSLLEVARIQGPRYLICGHVHNKYGEMLLPNNRPTKVINVAMCGFPEKKIIHPPRYLYLD